MKPKLLLVGNLRSPHLSKLATLFSDHYDVTILTVGASGHNVFANHPKIRVNCIPFSGAFGYFLGAFSLKFLVKKYKYDVVNVHYASGYGFMAACTGIRTHCLSCWGSDVYEFPYRSRLHMAILCFSIQQAWRIGSTSMAMAEQIRKLSPNAHVFHTPFFIDNRFLKDSKLQPRRNQDVFVIGSVKALEPVYNTALQIRALAEVRNTLGKEAPIRLKIAGEGTELERLKRLSQHLGISDAVDFLGYVAPVDVVSLLDSFDLFVQSSNQESFGVALLEAASRDVTCISSRTVGGKELVRHRIDGLTFPIGDHETLAKYICELYQDPKLRTTLAMNFKKKVCQLYTAKETQASFKKYFGK